MQMQPPYRVWREPSMIPAAACRSVRFPITRRTLPAASPRPAVPQKNPKGRPCGRILRPPRMNRSGACLSPGRRVSRGNAKKRSQQRRCPHPSRECAVPMIRRLPGSATSMSWPEGMPAHPHEFLSLNAITIRRGRGRRRGPEYEIEDWLAPRFAEVYLGWSRPGPRR